MRRGEEEEEEEYFNEGNVRAEGDAAQLVAKERGD